MSKALRFVKNLAYLSLAWGLILLSGCGTVSSDSTSSVSAGSNSLEFFTDNDVSSEQWQNIGETFDSIIYPKVTSKFSTPLDEDGNNQVIILFYTMSVNNLGGYFWAGDFFSEYAGSNEMEILYINKTHMNVALDTISHEFQHLVNASQRVRIAAESNAAFTQQSTWMDEGLAESATHYVNNEVMSDHITNFNAGQLRNGTPLLKWTNVFNDYTQSYLFFQYIKNQASNGVDIFKSIIDSEYADYRAVETIVTSQNENFSDFTDIFKGYTIANLVQENTGIYGYAEENSLFNLNLPADPTNASSLFSGGTLYSYPSEVDLGNFSPSGSGSNIRFIRINKEGTENSIVSNLSIPSFNQTALITLNINTNKDAGAESVGTLPNSTYPSSRRFKITPTEFALKCFGGIKATLMDAKQNMLRASIKPSMVTYETTTHTFNTYNFSNNQNNVEITASLRYGTATSNCLIFSAD